MSVLQAQIFHPTYMRLLCLHVRRRGVSLADALAGTGMTWRQLLHEKRLIAFGAECGHVMPDRLCARDAWH